MLLVSSHALERVWLSAWPPSPPREHIRFPAKESARHLQAEERKSSVPFKFHSPQLRFCIVHFAFSRCASEREKRERELQQPKPCPSRSLAHFDSILGDFWSTLSTFPFAFASPFSILALHLFIHPTSSSLSDHYFQSTSPLLVLLGWLKSDPWTHRSAALRYSTLPISPLRNAHCYQDNTSNTLYCTTIASTARLASICSLKHPLSITS